MFYGLLDALFVPSNINLALPFLCLLQFLDGVILLGSASLEMNGLACPMCFGKSLSVGCLCHTMSVSLGLFVDKPWKSRLASLENAKLD